uniref:Ribonuclease H-like domain-containing protein n=1 Tax=Tanacetum cinerariifolium TaxID=118510 RepID=A0A6L2MPE3_TANCI|nr:ribonuclease H-like domain-containing protein [Tanacetum cinerariifolium]
MSRLSGSKRKSVKNDLKNLLLSEAYKQMYVPLSEEIRNGAIEAGTRFSLQLFASSTSSLIAYSDVDLAGCPFTRRTTSGYCVFLGDNLLLSWSSKRQHTISRSSAEVEYQGVVNAVAETAWSMFLSQRKYAMELLKRAHVIFCNFFRTPVDTKSKPGPDGDPVSDPTLYRSLTGGLQYLTFTRLDISYAVQQICLHMHDPREPHLAALKRILQYVGGRLMEQGWLRLLMKVLLDWDRFQEAAGLDTRTGQFEAPNSYVGGAEVTASSSGEVNKDSSVSTKECKIDEATRVACESFDAAMNEIMYQLGNREDVNDTVNIAKEVVLLFKSALITFASLLTNEACKLKFKSTKQVYQHVFKKNDASTSATKKKSKTTRQMKSTSNPFDAHKKVENDDELGANGGIFNTVDNVANHPYVATSSLRMNRERVGLVKGKNKEITWIIKRVRATWRRFTTKQQVSWHLRADVEKGERACMSVGNMIRMITHMMSELVDVQVTEGMTMLDKIQHNL